MPTVAANGIDIYYERSGEGPRLLFLNGSGSTLATSALLIKPFAERFDVAAHDQRGLGRTSVPPGRTRWPTMRQTRSRCSITWPSTPPTTASSR